MLETEKASFDEDSDEGEEVIYDFEAGEGYPGAKLAVMFGDQYEYIIYQKATNSQMMNEAEGETPLVITVKVTDKGKDSMRLYTGPSEITMTSAKNNSQMESDNYYIGNQKYELGKEVSVYFAVYRHDIKEIQTIYLIPKRAGQFKELVDSKSLNNREIENLPSDIRKVPDAYFKFENGFEKGMKDHRGYFEIV